MTILKLQMNTAFTLLHATLDSSAVGTSIRAQQAKVNLSGIILPMRRSIQAIPLQLLLAVYAPEQAASLTGAD